MAPDCITNLGEAGLYGGKTLAERALGRFYTPDVLGMLLARDVVREMASQEGADGLGSVAHRHSKPRADDHRQVVHVISHGADFRRMNAPECGDVEDGGPLARVVADHLAHRPEVTRAALDERPHPAAEPAEHGALEFEHLGAIADRAEVEVARSRGADGPA